MHPVESTFEAYVMGMLSLAERAHFVAHVAECDACSDRLQQEARVELALLDARAALPERPARPVSERRSRVVRLVFPVAAVLAVAALVVLFVRSRPRPVPLAAHVPAAPIPAVECRDLHKQASCIQEAHRHGLYVLYPSRAGVPPLGGGASFAGPSAPPIALARGGSQ